MAAGNDGAGATPGVGTMFAPKVFTCMLEQARCAPEPTFRLSPARLARPAPGAHDWRATLTHRPSPLSPPVSPRRLPDGDVGACGPAYHFPNLPHSPRFTRVWVQGVVVWTDGRGDDGDGRRRCVDRFALDDGTGPPLRIATPPSCHCASTRDPFTRRTPGVGDYVACVGFLAPNEEGGRVVATSSDAGGAGEKNDGRRRRRGVPRFTLVAERVHDLSREGDAQREAMWNVEVPEAFKTLEAAHAAG